MTNEEAKYPCRGCGITYCSKNCDKLNAWIEMSEANNEKQIPKKPIDNGIKLCPFCKSANVTSEEWCDKYNFCPDCGTAIDWSKK